jgi:hypothetical protein
MVAAITITTKDMEIVIKVTRDSTNIFRRNLILRDLNKCRVIVSSNIRDNTDKPTDRLTD